MPQRAHCTFRGRFVPSTLRIGVAWGGWRLGVGLVLELGLGGVPFGDVSVYNLIWVVVVFWRMEGIYDFDFGIGLEDGNDGRHSAAAMSRKMKFVWMMMMMVVE